MKKISSLFLFIAAAMMLTSCSNLMTSPTSVSKEFLTAIKYGDFAKARQLSSPDSQKAIATLETFSSLSKFKDVEFTIVDQEIDGEYAVVYYTTSDSDEKQNLRLKKNSEKGWEVIFTKSDFPAASGNNWDININSNENEELRKSVEGVGEAAEDLVNTFFVAFEDDIEKFAKDVERAAEDFGKAVEKKAPMIEEKIRELDKKYDQIEVKYDKDEISKEQYRTLKKQLDVLKDELNDLNRQIKKQQKKGIFDK